MVGARIAMPTISGRYYSGFGYTGYRSLVIHRARMAEANERAFSAVSTLTSTVSNAATSLSQGLAELATRAAIKRMSDEAAAKAAAAKSGLNLTT
jgi:hypothetical protein